MTHDFDNFTMPECCHHQISFRYALIWVGSDITYTNKIDPFFLIMLIMLNNYQARIKLYAVLI